MSSNIHHKYVIVGAGPAGVQLGYYLRQRGADFVILERSDKAGSFFEEFPRHRQLISINKRFTGSDDPEFSMRHDWNSLLSSDPELLFKHYDEEYFPQADSFVRYINDYVRKEDLPIRFGTTVKKISRHEGGYTIACESGETYVAEVLIVATGFHRPLIPEIPGIEHAVNYNDMCIDRKGYENQRVLIIGKGNSAFETADHLVPAAAVIHLCSPNSITMAWKSHYVGNLRAVNNTILDSYQLKSQNAVLDADIRKIEKTASGYHVNFAYKHANGEVEVLSYDKVLCCTGYRIDTGIFDDAAAPELTIRDKYPKLTSQWESVNQPHMYFVGTLSHSRDYRKATSGFIHGFRYNARALEKLLAQRYGAESLPVSHHERSASAVAEKILERANRSGGLWQQPGFLADFFWLEDDETVSYGIELPVDYVQERSRDLDGSIFALTLEYGDPIEGDPFCVERVHREDAERARLSQFLHPKIREFRDGVCVGEHDVIEDLESRWVEPVHLDPLVEYLERTLCPPTTRPSSMAKASKAPAVA